MRTQLQKKLLCCYPFDEQNQAEILLDSQKNYHARNHGTTPVAGRMGLGRQFQKGQRILIPVDRNFANLNQISISLWIRFTEVDNSYTYLFGIPQAFSFRQMRRNEGKKDDRVLFFDVHKYKTPSRKDIHGPRAIKDQWYHLVGIYNAGKVLYYCNGQFVGQALTSGPLPYIANAPILIGGNQNNLESFVGIVDETAIWFRELSPEEIAWLYNSGIGNSLVR